MPVGLSVKFKPIMGSDGFAQIGWKIKVEGAAMSKRDKEIDDHMRQVEARGKQKSAEKKPPPSKQAKP